MEEKVKLFFVYCSECKQHVEEIRKELESRAEVLRLRDISEDTPENTPKNAWHKNALKMIEQADVIVYVVSEHTAENENVEWELRQSVEKQKQIICLKLSSEYEINKSFYYFDSFTKENRCRGKVARNQEALCSYIDDLNSAKRMEKIDNTNLLELYKSFSATAESLLERRQTVNSFYTSANAALITLGATVIALSEGQNLVPKMLILIAVSIPGLILNRSWGQLLDSYQINNSAKISVLSNLEKTLGASLYDEEWAEMKGKGYKSFSKIERNVPRAFFILFLLVDVIAAIFALVSLLSGLFVW